MTITERFSNTILWIIAIVLVMLLAGFFMQRISNMQKKVDRANEVIAIMQLEHQAAIIAAKDASKGRKEVYEEAKDKLCRAETALGKNSVFCDMPIPDDLRLLWDQSSDHIASHGLQSAD